MFKINIDLNNILWLQLDTSMINTDKIKLCDNPIQVSTNELLTSDEFRFGLHLMIDIDNKTHIILASSYSDNNKDMKAFNEFVKENAKKLYSLLGTEIVVHNGDNRDDEDIAMYSYIGDILWIGL